MKKDKKKFYYIGTEEEFKKLSNHEKDENRIGYFIAGIILTLFCYTIIKFWEWIIIINLR